jgi:hypothetical protein
LTHGYRRGIVVVERWGQDRETTMKTAEWVVVVAEAGRGTYRVADRLSREQAVAKAEDMRRQGWFARAAAADDVVCQESYS